ncbi:MAG: hypothetical protein LBJ31_11295 [Treponema sp.]|jgi:hypothetical protein|nr:hypothetical protein [Treponema sp.]
MESNLVISLYFNKKVVLTNHLLIKKSLFSRNYYNLCDIQKIEILNIHQLPIYYEPQNSSKNHGHIVKKDFIMLLIFDSNGSLLFFHSLNANERNNYCVELVKKLIRVNFCGKITIKFNNGNMIHKNEIISLDEANQYYIKYKYV